MWHLEQCENLDSCDPGAEHLFPEPGTRVNVPTATEGQVIGQAKEAPIPEGTYEVGKHILYEAHQVSITVDDKLVWIDIDEIVAIP